MHLRRWMPYERLSSQYLVLTVFCEQSGVPANLMHSEVWGGLPNDVLWLILETLPISTLAKLAIESRSRLPAAVYKAQLEKRQNTLKAGLFAFNLGHYNEGALKKTALIAIGRFLSKQDVFAAFLHAGASPPLSVFRLVHHQVMYQRLWVLPTFLNGQPIGRPVIIQVRQIEGDLVEDMIVVVSFLPIMLLTLSWFITWCTGIANLLPRLSRFSFGQFCLIAILALALVAAMHFWLWWRRSQWVQQELVIRAPGLRISMLAEWSSIRCRRDRHRRGRLQCCTALLDALHPYDSFWMSALLLRVIDDHRSQFSRSLPQQASCPSWKLLSQSFSIPPEVLSTVWPPQYRRAVRRSYLLPLALKRGRWVPPYMHWVSRELEHLHLVCATWKPHAGESARWMSYFRDWSFL